MSSCCTLIQTLVDEVYAMKMYWLIFLFMFVFYADIAHCEQTYYEYSSIYYDRLDGNGEHYVDTVVIDRTGKANTHGLSGAPYGGCEDKSWICSFSLNLNFAIPANWEPSNTSWEYKGYEHNVLGKLNIKYLGTDIEVYLMKVVSQYPQEKNYIFYSKKYGVVGFTLFFGKSDSEDELELTFISERKYGYGSLKWLSHSN